jgi:hypothetical protein
LRCVLWSERLTPLPPPRLAPHQQQAPPRPRPPPRSPRGQRRCRMRCRHPARQVARLQRPRSHLPRHCVGSARVGGGWGGGRMSARRIGGATACTVAADDAVWLDGTLIARTQAPTPWPTLGALRAWQCERSEVRERENGNPVTSGLQPALRVERVCGGCRRRCGDRSLDYAGRRGGCSVSGRGVRAPATATGNPEVGRRARHSAHESSTPPPPSRPPCSPRARPTERPNCPLVFSPHPHTRPARVPTSR